MQQRHPSVGVLALALLALGLGSVQAQAHEELGRMWTFESAPLDWFESEYGFRPDQAWLDHARAASLRYGGGCSASFVSPRGLIMTNHHCARDNLVSAAPEGEDWLESGFFARSLEAEVRVEGLTVQQLVRTEDVTERMNDGLADMVDAEKRRIRLENNREAILEAARKSDPKLDPQVVNFYQGGVYTLYFYRVYDDIRLVAAPQMKMAKFGGDPDNFTFPRFSLDYTFVRAYDSETGRPIDSSKNYFKWRTQGPQEDELTFVTGNPGSTGRLDTWAQMQLLRDASYPRFLRQTSQTLAELTEAMKTEGATPDLKARKLRAENGFKAISGYLEGLSNPEVIRIKKEAEAELRERIAATPELSERYGVAFEILERTSELQSSVLRRITWYAPPSHPWLVAGRNLAIATDPTRGETERAKAAQALETMSFEVSDAAVARYEAWLSDLVEDLGADEPLAALLLGDGPVEGAALRLAGASELKDAELRKRLVAAGRSDVLASEDPALRAGLLLALPPRPAMIAEYRKARAEEADARKMIGEAVFAVYGTSVPPDATFTLRISDGIVTGFPMNGTIAPWFTSLYGLYARNTEFGNKAPFDLPSNWLEALDRLDLSTPFNLVSTNDIIGGNSGSPMIDKELRVVGLVFDGNIESLANRFVFTDEVARTVSVHPGIIIESLRKVYDSNPLADEIEGKGPGYK